jgi:hypothetical protein
MPAADVDTGIASIFAGAGLSGGGTAAAVTLALPQAGVTAASYGSASSVATFTVDVFGRLTTAASTPIALPTTQINQQGAGTDDVLRWNGSAWSPAVVNAVQIRGVSVSALAPNTNQVLAYNGSIWIPTNPGSPSYPLAANPTGSASAPAYSFNADTDTGMYQAAADVLAFATNGTERMRIASGLGYVGIGTNNPSYPLEVNGTIKATNLYLTSDARKKYSVRSLDSESSLRKICSIRPVSFRWRSDRTLDEGFLAQELREVYPELVITNPDGSLSVKYTSLIAPMVSSVQEMNSKIEKLERENLELKAALQEILRELRKQK